MKYACLFFMMVGACFALNGQQAGDLDASFNANNAFLRTPNASKVSCVAIQNDDNKIVVGGTTGTRFSLGRLKSTGVVDSSFDTNNAPAIRDGFYDFELWDGDGTNKEIPDLKLQADNKITFVGLIEIGGHKRGVLQRYIPPGPEDDISLTNNDIEFPVNDEVVHAQALELMGNGKMLLAGGVLYNGLDWDVCISRHVNSGALDPFFGPNGFDTLDLGGDEKASAMLFDGNQETFVVGSTTLQGGLANGFLAKFVGPNPDTTWAPRGYRIFGENGMDSVMSMAWHTGRRILVAGSSDDNLSRDQATIWRFLESGLPDLTFGNNGKVVLQRPAGKSSRFEKILVQPDGKIIGIGWEQSLTNARAIVSRFDTSGFPDLTFGLPADSGTVVYNILPNIAYARNGAFQVLNNQLYLIIVGDAISQQGRGFVARIFLDYNVCAAAPVNITLTGDTMVCTYDCTTLSATATNAIDYQWESYQAHDSTRLVCSISEDETYSLTATSASGCTATDSITVHVSPVVPTIASNSPVCEGDTLRLNASGGLAYQWERPDGVLVANSELLFAATNGTESGLYQVTATDAIGCTGSVGQFVQINLPPSFSLQTPPTITSFENGQNAYISTNLQANTLLYWQLGNLANTTASPLWGQDSTSFFSIPISLVAENAPGTATVSLWASENNCFADTLIVPLSVWPLVNDTDGLFIPEIFTPNGDGANDEWVVSTNPNPLPNDLSVKIYNKQGVPVWVESPWDGRWDGANSPEGVYWYVIGNANNEAIAKGSLMLLRN